MLTYLPCHFQRKGQRKGRETQVCFASNRPGNRTFVRKHDKSYWRSRSWISHSFCDTFWSWQKGKQKTLMNENLFFKPLRKFIKLCKTKSYEIIFLFFGNLFKSETCEVEVENCIINAKWRICQVHLTNATFLMIFPHFDALVVSFYPNGKI